MKLIFIFLSFFGFNFHFSTFKTRANETPEIGYQLENHQIIKRMETPIVVEHHGENLLWSGVYATQTQLILPAEDLEYMRSNKIPVNLSFAFQFEWWNDMEYQVVQHPNIVQSLKSQDIIDRPRQIIARLTWPSIYIHNNRPFAHAMLFYYDQNFNLMMANQLESDLVGWEIRAAENETKGVPQHYRIRLTNLQLSYSLPKLFENLQNKFIEIPNFYSRHEYDQWWIEFNQIFLNSDFITIDHFDDFLIRPIKEDFSQKDWDDPSNGENQYLDLSLTYQNYDYLKIYKYFFAQPRLKIIYHQYLDLTFEFDQTILILEPQQNYWDVFKQKHHEFNWWLNRYVEPILANDKLILKSKDSNLVRGEAKIQLIKQKTELDKLNLQSSFEYLQFNNKQSLSETIFKIFKTRNSIIFANEIIENYQIIETNISNQFILKALEKATFSGDIYLKFKEIKNSKIVKDLPTNSYQENFHDWPFWAWILLGLIIGSVIVLIVLKFTKSKPTKK